MKTAPHRLAVLCYELGIISDDLLHAILKAVDVKGAGGQKSLVEILTSEVSVKTFKEFASYEIRMSGGGRTRKEGATLTEPALRIKDGEILEILLRNRPALKQLDQTLLEYDARYQEELDARPVSPGGEIPEELYNEFCKRLVEHKTLSMERLNAISASRNLPHYEANRFSLIRRVFEQNQLLTAAQFEQALNTALRNGDFLSRVLEQTGVLPEIKFCEALSRPLDLPWLRTERLKLKQKVLQLLPETLYHREVFLLFEADAESLKLAQPDPLNFELADALSILTGKTVHLYFAAEEKIVKLLNKTLGAQAEAETKDEADAEVEEEPVSQREAQAAARADQTVSEQELQARATITDSQSVVQLVKSILDRAVEAQATDIHLEPQSEALRVRFRIDGMLHKIMDAPKSMMLPVISRIKVLGEMDVTERRRPQDGHFNLVCNGSKYDFRVSSIPANLGEKLVIRALREQSTVSKLTDLGMDPAQQETMRRLIRRTYGCILATGPTGSGKTTTLYTALNLLNTEDRNLVTIEDPIEYEIPGINQIQVDIKANVTFANGLRATLRQDPDVIMVGEIRDPETAQVATRAALTGHLVFSTLHTNTTVGAITTLIHMGVPPLLIASALAGIISQRLVRRICRQCVEPLQPTPALREELGLPPDSELNMFRGRGCKTCWNTGYSGRDGIYEILSIDDELRNLITGNASELMMLEYAIAGGMQTLKKSALNKMREGVTTPDEVLKTVFMNN